MENNKRKPILKGLYFVRALAFLAVFFQHINDRFIGIGGWGVSIFIVLSGFLMVYQYYDKDEIIQNSFIINICG